MEHEQCPLALLPIVIQDRGFSFSPLSSSHDPGSGGEAQVAQMKMANERTPNLRQLRGNTGRWIRTHMCGHNR